MKTKLTNIWEALHDSYWFVPTLMVIGSILMAIFLLFLDQKFTINRYQVGNLSVVYGGGIESARNLLSDLAGSIITIAGVSFSVTIVTLSLASTQYGPHLLRHYMRNTGNQIVLGTFVSTYIYCLLVYSQIPDVGIWDSPPRIAISFAIILAVGSIGVFIYFIHHMSEFIRSDIIIMAAFHELLYSIDRLYPEKLGLDIKHVEHEQPSLPPDFDSNSRPVSPGRSAYLQAVEGETLVKLACENDLLIRLDYRPGDFLIVNRPMARVYPAEHFGEPLEKELAKTFILGSQRTPEQDVEFAIYEIVEIALRALSPSLNDPFTAMSCLDRLTAGLCRLMERRFPSSLRFDDNHQLRVISRTTSFDEYVEAAIGPIRRNGQNHELVKRHLIKNLQILINHAHTDTQRQSLLSQMALVNSAQ